MFKYLTISAISMLALSVSTQAHAQEAKPFDLSAEVAVVSDYRFRGVSLSNEDFALQGSVALSTQSGFYGSVWASNISEYGGAKTEVDLAAGWAGALGPLSADVSVVGYLYPNGEGVNYYELAGSLSKEFGPLGTKVGMAYSPKQNNIGDVDNLYVYGEASYAINGSPFSLQAHMGYEDGIYTSKYDYSVGANYDFEPFALGVSYITVDSDASDELGSLAQDTVLVTLKARF